MSRRRLNLVKSRLAAIAKKHFASTRGVSVFIFGSRAGGHFTTQSDFDVGIMIRKRDGALARVPLRVLSHINEELETIPLLQRIDLVDFSRVNDEFKSVALQRTVPVYET
jgi:predicted nucleotidyltransferase